MTQGRHSDWERRLAEFISQNRDRPFEWGSWDCALFATAAAEAITGLDKASAYRGRYTSREGSAQALRQLGKGTLLRTFDSQFQRKPVGLAGRGDLIWTQGSVGVCMGAFALFVSEDVSEGLVSVHRSEWLKAWAV